MLRTPSEEEGPCVRLSPRATSARLVQESQLLPFVISYHFLTRITQFLTLINRVAELYLLDGEDGCAE